MPVNDTTTNQGYQKPNIANQLSDDVGRLRSALDSIDTDMAARLAKAGGVMTGALGVTAGTAGAPSVYFTGDTNTGIYSPGADTLAVSTNGSIRALIDSSGRLGLGTSSPDSLLHLSSSDVNSLYISLERTGSVIPRSGIHFKSNNAGTDYWGGKIICGDNGTQGTLQFYSSYRSSVEPSTADMTLLSSGELLIGTATRTANGGVLQVSNGITFPATQSACSDANTLDDYEEGTFTPIAIGSTTAGTATHSIQNGRYTKTGNVVHFALYMNWSAGTGTGNLLISGLPYTVVSYFSACSLYLSNLALTANNVPAAYCVAGAQNIQIKQYPAGGGVATLVPYDAAVSELMIAGHYFTA